MTSMQIVQLVDNFLLQQGIQSSSDSIQSALKALDLASKTIKNKFGKIINYVMTLFQNILAKISDQQQNIIKLHEILKQILQQQGTFQYFVGNRHLVQQYFHIQILFLSIFNNKESFEVIQVSQPQNQKQSEQNQDDYQDEEDEQYDGQHDQLQMLLDQIKLLTFRLAENVGEDLLRSIYLQYIHSNIGNTTNHFIFATLVLSRQFCSNFKSIIQIHDFVQFGICQLNNSSTKIKLQAIKFFVELVQVIKPQFQNTYHNTLVPLLIQKIKDVQVRSEVVSCLRQFFFQYQNINCVMTYFSIFMQYFDLCMQSTMENKSQIIQLLGYICSVKGIPKMYLQKIMLNCSQNIQSYPVSEQNDVITMSFYTISIIICNNYTQEQAAGYITYFVQKIIQRQSYIDEVYFLQFWKNLCGRFTNFVDLSIIVPILFQKFKNITQEFGEQQKILSDFESIQKTIQSFDGRYLSPFFQLSYNYLKQFIDLQNKYNNYESLIIRICIYLLKITDKVALSQNNPTLFLNMAGQLFNQIDICLNNQKYEDKIYGYLQGLGESISNIHQLLDEDHIVIFIEKLLSYNSCLFNIYNKLKNQQQYTTQNQDQDLLIKATTKEQIINVSKSITKNYSKTICFLSQNKKIKINQLFITQIQNNIYLQNWNITALYMTVSFIQNNSFQNIQIYWQICMDIFQRHLYFSQPQYVQLSIKGMAHMIQKLPFQYLHQQNLSQSIQKILQSQYSLASKIINKSINSIQNVVNEAIGIILKHTKFCFSSLVKYYKTWIKSLSHMNITFQLIQTFLYAFQVINTQPMVIVQSQEDMITICILLAESYCKTYGESELQNVWIKSSEVWKNICKWQPFQNNANRIYNNLNILHQNMLKKMLQN